MKQQTKQDIIGLGLAYLGNLILTIVMILDFSDKGKDYIGWFGVVMVCFVFIFALIYVPRRANISTS